MKQSKSVVMGVFFIFLLLVLSLLLLVRLQAANHLPRTAAASPTPFFSPLPVTASVSAAPEETEEPESDLPRIDITGWQYTLASASHPIGDYAPPALTTLEGGHQFDSRAAVSLQNFIDGARSEGLSVCLSSAYRNYSDQSYLYNRKVQQLGGDYEAAARIVLPPGTSEHQLGLCADITDQFYEVKTAALENTALFQWMQEHCAEYGFILRYPADKEDITGVIYEPWHFRYVGEEAAAYITEHGLCLEEFLELYE